MSSKMMRGNRMMSGTRPRQATGRAVRPSTPARYRQAAGGKYYESVKGDGIPDFSLTPEQLESWESTERIGWCGYYRDIKAMLGARCEWVPMYKGERVDNPRMQAVIDEMIKPCNGSQEQMRFRSLQLQVGLGEHATWPVDTPTGVRWVVAHPMQLRKGSLPGTFAHLTRRDAKPGAPGWAEHPIAGLRRHHIPNPGFEDEATTALCRVFPEIRLYRSIVQNMQRGVDSRMLMNGLLWVGTLEGDIAGGEDNIGFVEPYQFDDYGVGLNDVPSSPDGGSSLDQLLDEFVEYSSRAYRDVDGNDVASRVPFPFPHHTKPEVVELGRAIDKESLESLQVVVEAGARGLNINPSFLVAGPGTNNHWGDAEARRDLHERSVSPELSYNDAFWSEWAFRPILRRMIKGQKALEGTNPEDWSLGSDLSKIEIKADQPDLWLKAQKCGIITPDYAAERLGVPEGGRLQPPPGFTEWDHYLATVARPQTAEEVEESTNDREPSEQLALQAAAVAMLPSGR